MADKIKEVDKYYPLVTIVTVVFNAENDIEDTIKSVLSQTYPNLQYIVIDGASTDNTLTIIKKYENDIDILVSEKDKGIYDAMNKAIHLATGEWINFMNAGDTFYDHTTVEYVMTHKDNKAELIYGDYQIKDSGAVVKARDVSQWYVGMPFCHQTLFTRTSIMKKELFDTSFRIAADHNFIIKMYHDDKSFFYIDKTIAIFREGGFADSNGFLMFIESIKVFLDNNVSEDEIRKSNWYKKLHKYMCAEQLQQIKTLKEENEQYYTLFKANTSITEYSIFKHPLKKYSSYKNMLKQYYKVKKYFTLKKFK